MTLGPEAHFGSTRMVGNKWRMLEQEFFQAPLLAAINTHRYARFIDAFAGTATVSMYVGALGELPSGSMVNEIDKLRHVDICQSVQHPEDVVRELEYYGTELRKICFEAIASPSKSGEATLSEIENWEAARNEDKNITQKQRMKCRDLVQTYLLKELKINWLDDGTGPQNNAKAAAISKLLQFNMYRNMPVEIRRKAGDGSPASATLELRKPIVLQMVTEAERTNKQKVGVRIFEGVHELIDRTRKMSKALAGSTISQADGYELLEAARPGDVIFIDPPYLHSKHQREIGGGLRYTHGDGNTHDIKHAKVQLEKIEKAWDKGVHILMTHRWDDDFIRLLVSRGWRISGCLRGQFDDEMVITNFDWEGGTGAIRTRRDTSPYVLLADAHHGKAATVRCDYAHPGGVKSEEREGVVIGDHFYTEFGGYLERFEAQSSGRRSSRLTKTVVGDATVWQRSADQSRLPQVVEKNSGSAADAGPAEQEALAQAARKRHPPSTLERLRSLSPEAGPEAPPQTDSGAGPSTQPGAPKRKAEATPKDAPPTRVLRSRTK